ncbi:MAG: efflux RND transporter periplasmic adaptor subunit, partial [Deltaproteobacteria bacterium]|nr:efflux RND transporter periplasmic adaptor subunit [Deltaproteobacteria bacterium]
MSMKARSLILFFILLPAVLIPGFFSVRAKEKASKPVSARVEKPIPVQVMEIHNQKLPLVVEAVGRLYPNRQVTVTAEVPGLITSYAVDQGDRVRAGQFF